MNKRYKGISLEDTIAYADNIIVDNFDDEIMMMNIKREKYYGLDPVGSEIWKRISSPVTVEKLISVLTEEYGGEEETIKNDVIPFLNRLLEEGMIRIVRS